jgi:hypothetical protein
VEIRVTASAPRLSSELLKSFRILAADTNEEGFASALYQHIEEAESCVVALYTRSQAEITRQFELLSRRSGLSIYTWTMDRGYISLRENGIVVPGTRRIPDAIRYVQQSAHFGVYLTPSDAAMYAPPLIAQLRQMARTSDGVVRKIVLMSEDGEIPATLSSYCAHIQLEPRSRAPLRLRDGRWVR